MSKAEAGKRKHVDNASAVTDQNKNSRKNIAWRLPSCDIINVRGTRAYIARSMVSSPLTVFNGPVVGIKNFKVGSGPWHFCGRCWFRHLQGQIHAIDPYHTARRKIGSNTQIRNLINLINLCFLAIVPNITQSMVLSIELPV